MLWGAYEIPTFTFPWVSDALVLFHLADTTRAQKTDFDSGKVYFWAIKSCRPNENTSWAVFLRKAFAYIPEKLTLGFTGFDLLERTISVAYIQGVCRHNHEYLTPIGLPLSKHVLRYRYEELLQALRPSYLVGKWLLYCTMPSFCQENICLGVGG